MSTGALRAAELHLLNPLHRIVAALQLHGHGLCLKLCSPEYLNIYKKCSLKVTTVVCLYAGFFETVRIHCDVNNIIMDISACYNRLDTLAV